MRVRYAMENASGWKELKSMVTRAEYMEIKEQYEFTFGDEEMDSEEEFDGSFLDEDYYQHPGVYMTDWLPEDIIHGFGKQGISLMDGIITNFEPADEEKIIAELTNRGYRCKPGHNLMAFAMGEYCETIPVDEFILKPKSEKSKPSAWFKR